MDLAVQGTMVMEIQPISSCNSETKKRNSCTRTISNKVKQPDGEWYPGNHQESCDELAI